MHLKQPEVAAASRIGTASATCPVLRILSAIVFVSAVALIARRSEKLQETPSITFTKSPPVAQGGGGCSLGRLTSDRDGDRWCRART